jgi:NADH:ubiquinone oxidoreductase subunit F (NADH-binding)/(2Fe-2S) ferredoxin
VACLVEGPICHDDEGCRRTYATRTAALRREVLARPAILVGMGTCGQGAGAARTLEAIRRHLAERKLDADVVEVGCIGLCSAEPIVDVQLPGRMRVAFGPVAPTDVPDLLDRMLAGTVPAAGVIGQHRVAGLEPWPGVGYLDEHPFFAPQTRWVLANCGVADPSDIDEYIARGGYKAFAGALRSRTPGEVCDLVEQSGLRGRGGAGFSAGAKWKLARGSPGEPKYLVCNADEGDPGAFMDRAIVEGDPHRLVEGMALAAYAIGATAAFVYIRAEYPLATGRLATAISQAWSCGLLGHSILDSGFDLDVKIKAGAGAFVCGEETALIHSLEGRRGMPRPRPPYPTARGLFEKPTVLHNVETLANVPAIVARGPAWFASVGTAASKGTKVFSLSGKVVRTGLVEVPLGTPLGRIVLDIGGGVPGGKTLKAVQVGGPSGGCLPASQLAVAADYESLRDLGAVMGSGGLVVVDEDTCMVDLARFFMDFIQRESCGKCIPCREGTRRMLEILQRITRSRGTEKGLDALERFHGVMYLNRLAEVIKDASLCGLGQAAANPVLSTLRWFRDEYEAHVYERRCPAGVCTELMNDNAECGMRNERQGQCGMRNAECGMNGNGNAKCEMRNAE